LEPRLRALEDKFDRIEAKLNGISTDLAEIKGKLSGMPGAYEFGQLKGRVDSLPTTAKAATLLGIAGTLITIILKWPELKVWFAG
jgi:hypothetical protein